MSDATLPPSAEERAAYYVENVLVASEPQERANAALSALHTAHGDAARAASDRRLTLELIEQREADITIEQRATYHDLSATAFEKYLRTVLTTDDELRRLRAEVRGAQDAQERAEHTAREAELAIKIANARMTELGGLLNFYAAVKGAASQ